KPDDRKQLSHVAKPRAKFAVDRSRIEAQNVFGKSPALPRHEKDKVSRGVAQHRVGAVDDVDDNASRWIDEDMFRREVAVDALKRPGRWRCQGCRAQPIDSLIDHGIHTSELCSCRDPVLEPLAAARLVHAELTDSSRSGNGDRRRVQCAEKHRDLARKGGHELLVDRVGRNSRDESMSRKRICEMRRWRGEELSPGDADLRWQYFRDETVDSRLRFE